MSELTYTKNGDYLIPDISIRREEQPLGRFGRMRQEYLRQHRPVLWNSLILQEQLYPHLREIDEAAERRMTQITEELKTSLGVTERLKEADPMAWTGLMNSIRAQAEETVTAELVFS